MLKILHVSDLHIGKSGERTEQAKELLAKIDSRYAVSKKSSRSYLLITGDVVDVGTAQNVQTALRILGKFTEKIIIVPGNHDCSGTLPALKDLALRIIRLVLPVIPGFFYNDDSAKRFDNVLVRGVGIGHAFFADPNPFCWLLPDASNPEACVLGVNSCVKLEIGSSLGLIGYRQLTLLKSELAINYGIPKIVGLHHRPEGGGSSFFMTLQDWQDLIDIAQNRASVLAFGHEGPMDQIKDRNLRAQIEANRVMEVRSLPETLSSGKNLYLLDADRSIVEQAWYVITVDGGSVSVAKENG